MSKLISISMQLACCCDSCSSSIDSPPSFETHSSSGGLIAPSLSVHAWQRSSNEMQRVCQLSAFAQWACLHRDCIASEAGFAAIRYCKPLQMWAPTGLGAADPNAEVRQSRTGAVDRAGAGGMGDLHPIFCSTQELQTCRAGGHSQRGALAGLYTCMYFFALTNVSMRRAEHFHSALHCIIIIMQLSLLQAIGGAC